MIGEGRPVPARDADGESDVALIGVSAELERYAASATPGVPDGLVERILDAVEAQPTYSPVGRLLAALTPTGWPGFAPALAGLLRAVAGRPRPVRAAIRIEAAALLVVLACIVTGTGGLAVLVVQGMSAGPGSVVASPPGPIRATPPASSRPAALPVPADTPDARPTGGASPTPAATRARPSVPAPGGTVPPSVDRSGTPVAAPSSRATPSPRPEPSASESPAGASPDASGEPADGGGEPTASPEVVPGSSGSP